MRIVMMRGLLRRLIIEIGGMGRRGISYGVSSCFGYEGLMYSLCFHSLPYSIYLSVAEWMWSTRRDEGIRSGSGAD